MADEDVVIEDAPTPSSGNVPAPYVPPIPVTAEDFAQLVENPERPPEQQAAPPQELLNPHLFS